MNQILLHKFHQFCCRRRLHSRAGAAMPTSKGRGSVERQCHNSIPSHCRDKMRLIRVTPIPAATIVHAAGTSEVEAQIWGVMWCFARSQGIICFHVGVNGNIIFIGKILKRINAHLNRRV